MKFNLPESFAEDFEHYHLPKDLKNIGIMSDVHLPYHSNDAIEEALNYFITKKVDSILLNGDILDCYMLSKFQPDPRKRSFKEEIESFREFIQILKDNVTHRIFYKLGNHEERYEKIMISKAPEFLDLETFDFGNVLKLNDLGIKLITDQRIIYAGNLVILHGHELGMKSVNVNPARSLFLKTHVSALCSHLHRTSQHTEPSLKEDINCWSTGHLGEEHPKYARINKWNHGIARVEKDESGNFEVINFPLKRNKMFTV